MKILEAIDLREFVPIVLLIYLLAVVGQLMIPPRSEVSRWAARCSGIVFVLYAIAGHVAWPSTSAWDSLVIVLRATLAGGLAFTISKIGFAAFAFIYDRTIGELRRRIAEERAKRAADRSWEMFDWFKKREYEREQRALNPRPPRPAPAPPLDREKVAAEAKATYEKKLAIIDQASMNDEERGMAKEKAKQEYFRKLDEAV